MEITRTALHNKMKKLGIKSKEMKQAAEGTGKKDGPGLARKG